MRSRIVSACVLLQLLAVFAYGATFVVPSDRDMVRRAHAIVVGQALASYTQRTAQGGIETVTPFSIEEVIKGRITSDQINIYEPGGTYKDLSQLIVGVPRFEEGERVVLFLSPTGFNRWSVTDIALGKFTFATDRSGRKVAVRAEDDIVGWEPDGGVHHEMRRSADGFLAFLRTEAAAGGKGTLDYLVPSEPLQPAKWAKNQHRATVLSFTATSYTADFGSGAGARWNTFPQSFYTEPGTSAAAITAVTAGLGAWTGYTSAAIMYNNGGTDPCSGGCKTGGLTTLDHLNTVLWEQNLTGDGVLAFTCTAFSYGGTLGIGGPWASGTHIGPNGETFLTEIEGDVQMNQGVLGCLSPASPFPQGDLNSAVTHELGHTLGFRHADQTRIDDPGTACETDATLECAGTVTHSASAIMRSFINGGLNAALQPWDQHAAAAVYPAGSAPPTPTGVTATATGATSVMVTWITSPGATSYQVYRQAVLGGAYTLACTATMITCTDSTASANTAYLYSVRALNGSMPSGYSAYDLATTVIYTDDPLVATSTTIKAVHLSQLRTAVTAVSALVGVTPSYTGSATAGVTVQAVQIAELRTALDNAMAALSRTTGGYTDTMTAGLTVKAVHFQELRTRMK